MTRLLVIIALAAALIAGAVFWLANYADQHTPYHDKQTIEVDLNV